MTCWANGRTPVGLWPMPESDLTHGRSACSAALRELLCNLTASEPAGAVSGDVLLIDNDFADWPLNDLAVMQALQTWLKPPGRRLRMVGLDFDAVALAHPRFFRWRRDWAHRIEVWRPADGVWAPDLRGLLAGPVALQWLDAPDGCLRRLTGKVQVHALRERSAAFLQHCELAWPVTTLGL